MPRQVSTDALGKQCGVALGQRAGAAGSVAAKPFCGRCCGSVEGPSGVFDSVLAFMDDELLMEPIAVGIRAIEFEAGEELG